MLSHTQKNWLAYSQPRTADIPKWVQVTHVTQAADCSRICWEVTANSGHSRHTPPPEPKRPQLGFVLNDGNRRCGYQTSSLPRARFLEPLEVGVWFVRLILARMMNANTIRITTHRFETRLTAVGRVTWRAGRSCEPIDVDVEAHSGLPRRREIQLTAVGRVIWRAARSCELIDAPTAGRRSSNCSTDGWVDRRVDGNPRLSRSVRQGHGTRRLQNRASK